MDPNQTLNVPQRFAEHLTGKKNKNFDVMDTVVHPGERVNLAFPLPEILGYAPLYMPVTIINGKQAGPCALLFATMHGDEFNGMEIINRINQVALLKHLKGTLITVPVLNVYGMLNRSRHSPHGTNLNESFPGSQTGNLSSRLAHLFTTELLARSDVCVEIVSGALNHTALPHVYTRLESEENRELAKSFHVSVISESSMGRRFSLHGHAKDRDLPLITYEAGEAMRFDEQAIRLGVRGILNLLRKVGMLPEQKHKSEKKGEGPIVSTSSKWVYAPTSGIAHLLKKLGDRIKEGDLLARIKDPLGGSEEVLVKAPHGGLIVGINSLPLAYEGETLYRIASFDKIDEVAEKVQDWDAVE